MENFEIIDDQIQKELTELHQIQSLISYMNSKSEQHSSTAVSQPETISEKNSKKIKNSSKQQQKNSFQDTQNQRNFQDVRNGKLKEKQEKYVHKRTLSSKNSNRDEKLV